MKLVCAAHPTLDAVARCVSCGRHLCQSCRRKLGVRNYCRGCKGGRPARVPEAPRAAPPVAAPEGGAVALASEPRRAPRAISSRREVAAKSPTLAAVLSLLPGLGQLYASSFLRGALFFGAALAAQEWQVPAVLAAFLYVFNLFDAYRCAQARNVRLTGVTPDAKELRRDRVDDAAFSLTGLATLAYTFFEVGGMDGRPIDTLVPLAAVAACLVLAQETRS